MANQELEIELARLRDEVEELSRQQKRTADNLQSIVLLLAEDSELSFYQGHDNDWAAEPPWRS